MDFEALHSANFKLLDDTVGDWSTVLTNLETLKKDAEDGLHGQAKKSSWAGYNATVSREFIGKTAGEFGDALTQATSIRNIMRDTRDELKSQQRLLKEAIERGRGKNLTVTANGGGGYTVRENPDKKAPGGQTDVDGLRDEIKVILDKATEIDSTAATSLKALVDLTDYGFSDATYKNRDEAADALKEAERLAALAKKKPEDMTRTDFDALKSGLEKYSGDEIFAEHFATTLKPEGVLNFWAGLNDHHAAYKVGSERVDQYDDLQKALSLTLASATQADTPEMSRWKVDMVNLGDQPISRNSTMGFQVMSNLMRWGDYDDRFLNDYGNRLIETEKKLTDNGRREPMAWHRMGTDPLLNRTGTDSGADPMTGFMKALANSPDAATEFFNADFVTKDEDHEFERDTDNDGKNGKVGLSNFQYLFEERDWPQDKDVKGEDSIAGRNNLAMALEAATTGHPAGQMRTDDTPPHNAEQTKLMENLVQSISDNNKRLTDHGYMSDSMGQIASEYLPDINRATTETNADPNATQAEKEARDRIERLFPVAGSEAVMDHRAVSRFLLTVGQDPEGYAAVEVGQKAYMANLMDYHLNPDLPQADRFSDDRQLVVREIAHASGEVSATLNVGRQEATAGDAETADKEYEQSVAMWKSGISGVVGTGIGVGTSFVASPVVGAAAGGAASTVSGMILEGLFMDAEGSAKEGAGAQMGEDWENGLETNIKHTAGAADAAAKAHGLANPGDIAEYARSGVRDGYDFGGNFADRVAPELRTNI
ncbi:hypothetical protein [Streptomyces sp. CA-251247]|uniref:hypothetical protein n=1 Tax=Streptomyces sp. CA-251247 TaxID=3240062 RepID=UPI003D94CEFD